MKNEAEKADNQQGNGVLPCVGGRLDKWTIQLSIDKIKGMLNRGYGRTGKPLPQKRIKSLENKLKELEAALNGC